MEIGGNLTPTVDSYQEGQSWRNEVQKKHQKSINDDRRRAVMSDWLAYSHRFSAFKVEIMTCLKLHSTHKMLWDPERAESLWIIKVRLTKWLIIGMGPNFVKRCDDLPEDQITWIHHLGYVPRTYFQGYYFLHPKQSLRAWKWGASIMGSYYFSYYPQKYPLVRLRHQGKLQRTNINRVSNFIGLWL